MANPQKQVESLQAELGQQCYKFSDCVDLNNPQVATCSKGFTAVGWDDAGCGSKKCHCGKLICCPVNAAPKNCQWRGGKAGDCDGRCAAREVNIKGYRSSWGGGFKYVTASAIHWLRNALTRLPVNIDSETTGTQINAAEVSKFSAVKPTIQTSCSMAASLVLGKISPFRFALT